MPVRCVNKYVINVCSSRTNGEGSLLFIIQVARSHVQSSTIEQNICCELT